MIIGEDLAKTSSDLMGCTFRHQDYTTSFDGFSCKIYDTAGLNEEDTGRVPHWTAIRELYTLIRKLDGVTLLIYCVRGRIKNARANWTLFNDVICGGHVPVVLVMTGLEQEDDWDHDSRLNKIKEAFDAYNIKPKAIATVVSIRGKADEYLDMYKKSQERMRNLISTYRQPWSLGKETWFRDIYVRTYSTPGFGLNCFGVNTKVEFGQKMRAVVDDFAGQTRLKEGELKKLEEALLEAEREIAKQESGFKAQVLEFVKRKDILPTADKSVDVDDKDEPDWSAAQGSQSPTTLRADSVLKKRRFKIRRFMKRKDKSAAADKSGTLVYEDNKDESKQPQGTSLDLPPADGKSALMSLNQIHGFAPPTDRSINLPEIVDFQRKDNPTVPIYTFIQDGASNVTQVTRLEFGRACDRVSYYLQSGSCPARGIVAVLALSDSLLYHTVVVGIMRAGLIVRTTTI